MTRLAVLLAMTAALAVPAAAGAQDQIATRTMALGGIIGEPTGASGKLWVGQNAAFDGAVGWSWYDDGALDIHADYLLHNFKWLKPEEGLLPVYYGLGARLAFGDGYNKFGFRAPVGISYIFKNTEWDLFGELVPTLDLSPDVDFELGAAVGARYYLK